MIWGRAPNTHRHRLHVAIGLAAMVLAGCAVEPSAMGSTEAVSTSVAPSAISGPVTTTPVPSVPVVTDREPWIAYWAAAAPGLGVFLARPDGRDAHPLDFGVPGSFKHPDWSPDGRRIVAVREDDNTIWTIGANGQDARLLPVASCSQTCDYPAFSPDGRRLAFSVIESKAGVMGPAAGAIHVADVDGSNERVLARSVRPEVLDNPRWSPDGASLVIEIDRFDTAGNETGCSLALIDVATGTLKRATDPLGFGSFPDWGTGGIVFSEGVRVFQEGVDPVAGSFDLWLVDPDGGDPTPITSVPEKVHVLLPSWTPDGRSILATLEEPGRRTGILVDPVTGTWTEIGPAMSAMRLRPVP